MWCPDKVKTISHHGIGDNIADVLMTMILTIGGVSPQRIKTMTDQNNYLALVKFFQHSRYDVLQARTDSGWGPVWTFAPCDVRAAEQAGRMMRRLGAHQVRHSRRARLRGNGKGVVEALIVTVLPGKEQTVLHLGDGSRRSVNGFLSDECLEALEAALTTRRR